MAETPYIINASPYLLMWGLLGISRYAPLSVMDSIVEVIGEQTPITVE
jgi:hypothetical protein